MLDRVTLKTVKSMILDMDGVIWRGNESVGDLPLIFGELDHLGIKYAFATNNASKSVGQYIEKLKTFHLNVQPWQIVSSSIVTAGFLKEKFPAGTNIFVVGEDGFINTLAEFGFRHAEENVKAVIVGMDRGLSYEKLSKACNFIWDGALFIGANPDSSFPTPTGLSPGAGAIVAAIQTATGVKPVIMGKPFPTIIRLALERLNSKEEECLVVGDRIDTDITAGKRAGCRTALILSGVGTMEDLDHSDIHPDYIFNDLEELVLTIKTMPYAAIG